MISQDPLAQLPVEVASTSFDLLQIALGVAILVVVVFVHGAGIRRISRYFSERWVHVTTETPHWRINLLFGSVIAQLVIVHLIEVMVWALPIYWLGLIPELSAAANGMDRPCSRREHGRAGLFRRQGAMPCHTRPR